MSLAHKREIVAESTSETAHDRLVTSKTLEATSLNEPAAAPSRTKAPSRRPRSDAASTSRSADLLRDGHRSPALHTHPVKLLKDMPAMVCELRWDGTTLFVNQAARGITGYEADELQGRNLWTTLCPDELAQQIPDLLRRLRSTDLIDYEIIVQAKDGSRRTVSWNFSTSRNDGVPQRITGVGVDVTPRKLVADELEERIAKLRGALEGTIEAIAMTAELRDPYTAGHQRRVATLACAIAEAMGLSEERVRAVRMAGTIHDLGKISVPLDILSKRDVLTNEELELLKAHPQIGYAILKMVEFPWPIAEIVYQHHERIDGSGYPQGLSREKILLEARILAVCDVVESMAGPRPYRKALGIDTAIAEIRAGRGILYDGNVVDACLHVIQRIGFDWE